MTNPDTCRRIIRPAAWLSLLSWLMLGSSAGAQPAPALEIDEAHPERSVPSPEVARQNPMLMSDVVMDIAARAERAEKSENFAQAARYHEALAVAVPNRATAFAKACRMHDAAGESTQAVASCRSAMGKPGVTVDDTAFFVQLLLKAESPLPRASIDDVDALVTHLETELTGNVEGALVVTDLRCQIAAKLEDLDRLESCSARMAELAPRDPRSFAYSAIAALKKGDFGRVERLIADARVNGFPEPAITLIGEKMTAQRAIAEADSHDRRTTAIWIAMLLCSALAVGVTWFYQRRPKRLVA